MISGEAKTPACLVTGGAGFIGRHVADRIIAKGYRAIVLDDLSGGFKDNVPEGATFIEGSINNQWLVDDLFKRFRFEKVFHLAAYAAENLSHFIKRYNYQNNLLGSINLINAAVNHDTRCFIFTSSAAVYGDNPGPFHEEMTPKPEDSYGIAKWAVEHELLLSRRLFGLNSLIFRPHNVYGEYQNTGDPYRNVIGIFMRQLMENRPLTIFGDGEQTRAFTHVEDVASAIVDAADRPDIYNKTFNLGSDEPCSLNRLAEIVQSVFKKDMGIVRLEARHEVKHVQCVHAKAKQLLGYEPRIPLELGIARMAEWVKKTGVRASKEFTEIEIWKNMPRSWVPTKTTSSRLRTA